MLRSLYVRTLVGSRVAYGVDVPEDLVDYLDLLRSLYLADQEWSVETFARAATEAGLHPSTLFQVVQQLVQQDVMGHREGIYWFLTFHGRLKPIRLSSIQQEAEPRKAPPEHTD